MRNGHIPIDVRAKTHRERKTLNEIRLRGLTLQRIHGQGTTLRVIDPGVHIVAADLASLVLPAKARR